MRRPAFGAAKAPKYKNKRVAHGAIVFDSQAELARWLQLEAMEKAGTISDLQRQPSFDLLPKATINGKTVRKMVYRADFAYTTAGGDRIIEDVKGMLTPVYKMKRHMMKALLGLTIHEITRKK